MKEVKAIIRTEKLEPLKDAAIAAGISGMTVAPVHGCGTQKGWKEYFRGNEIIMNMVPKIQCEFIVDDDDVGEIVKLICTTCRTGEVGDGKIFIIPIEGVVRIRTGERDGDAI